MVERYIIKQTYDSQYLPEDFMIFGISIPQLPPSEIPLQTPDIEKMKLPRQYIRGIIRQELEVQAEATGQKAGGISLVVSEPSTGINADFAVACHRLAGPLRQSPVSIAESLAINVNSGEKPRMIGRVSALNGYLNFELDMDRFPNQVILEIEEQQENYGEQNSGNGETVVIDSSSPNIAKFMSVGHLRSTVIGESLARIYRASGYTVIRDNHLGDWGTQFGMLGRAHELWKDEIPELENDTDPVKGLYKLYVRMHEEVENEKELDPNKESSLEKEGREWFKRLEEGDPKALDLLGWATRQSLTEFQRVYDLLGAKFEYTLGESFYVGMIPDVLRTFTEKGVAKPDGKGALAVPLEEEKLYRLVIQKSDGSSLYATRDLAALVARTAWFKPNRILYVVGGDQKEYFQQLFAAYRKFTDGNCPTLEHVSFGMITLPEGKMSTRKGRVVFLEEVLSEAITRAKQKVQEGNKQFSEDEINNIARQVGVGAVIFLDLGQGRERNIKFDWDQALSIENNSSPYIQYAHARAQALLRRAREMGINIDHEGEARFDTENELALVKCLSKLPDAIQKAQSTNQPSVIADYLLQTANLFSQFYNHVNILKEVETTKRNSRLRLTAASAQVIRNSLYLLGIEAPEKI